MRIVKLGTLTKIKTGKLDANAANDNGKYPFFTCSREVLKINSYAYDCECVLLAGNGDLNVKYYSGKFEAYQRTYIIESIDKNKILVKYIYYFLSCYIEKLRNMSAGGVIKFIKLNYLTETLIPLPSIEIQRQIINELDYITLSLDNNLSIRKKYDEIIKSRFIEMFGDCKGVRRELGEISTVGSGDSLTAPSISEIKTPEYMYLVYGANGIRGYYKFANRHGKCVLVGRVGALAGNVHYYEGDFFATEHALVIETASKDVEPEWLSYELSRRNLFSISKGAAQPVISSSSLKKEIINIPYLLTQQQFVNFVHLIDKSKFVCLIRCLYTFVLIKKA